VNTRTRSSLLFAVVALFLTAQVFAVTYIVPSDRDLVLRADAIVIATGVDSFCRLNDHGAIVTTSELRVEEVLKGSVDKTALLRLDAPGGFFAGRATFIPGSPRFESGHRYLVFLDERQNGPVIHGMALGIFQFRSDLHGKRLLLRGDDEESIFGFEEADQTRMHVEKIRAEEGFLRFVRETVAGTAAKPGYFLEPGEVATAPRVRADASPKTGVNATRASYLLAGNPKWASVPNAVISLVGTQPGYDGPGAVSGAVSNWNGSGSGIIAYSVSGTDPSATGGLEGFGRGHADGKNAVLFNDPFDDFAMAGFGGSGAVGFGGISSSAGYLLDGVTYFDPHEIDIVIAKSTTFSINQATFTGLVTHEMGHTLGLRHSDENGDFPPNPPPCAAPRVCAGIGHAIMASQVAFNLSTLQQWDVDAAQTVYGSGPVCNAPQIMSQPSGGTITLGNSLLLSVGASGTAPLTYQWYTGNAPSTASPVGGATAATLNVSPSMTTSYWVQVNNSCGTPANSTTVTVTVNPPACPNVLLNGPGSVSIFSGSSTQLSVSASGGTSFIYQWYIGSTGSTAQPIAGGTSNSITVSPTNTTSYWVRVTNNCSNFADSVTATVNVSACAAPLITTQPSGQSILAGSTATFTFSASTNDPGATVRWYRGAMGDRTTVVANTAFAGTSAFTTPVLQTTTQYWAEVLTACGNIGTNTVTATVGPCTAAAITSTVPANGMATVSPGNSTTLSVNATGTALVYQWFVGATGITTTPVANGTTSSITVSPTSTTSYWVRVSNPCGPTVNSQTIVVTFQTCVAPTIASVSADQNIPYGSKATLTATISGTGPFTFTWFQGEFPDTSKPAGSGNPFVTATLTKDTAFWFAVNNSCGSKNLDRAIKVRMAKHRAAKK
jgi:hypothetical protein